MSNDINLIKKSLKNHIEIEFPYTFKLNEKVKYITLVNDEELFFNGGEFVKMGSEKINLRNGPNSWYVPIKIRDNNNNIIYRSRFFVNNNNNNNNINKSEEYLKKIIVSQQKIIEKMTETIKNDKLKIQQYEKLLKK
jgi:hypothetical protein